MKDAPDCRTCGACCFAEYDGDPFVGLDAADIARLSPHYQRSRVVDHLGRRDSKRTHLAVITGDDGTRCIALRGTLGKRVSCAIYERRPRACSTFVPGSRLCEETRRVAGLA